MVDSIGKPRAIPKDAWSHIINIIETVRSSSGNIVNPVFADLMDYKYRTPFGRINLVARRLFWVALPKDSEIQSVCSVITFSASDRDDYAAMLSSLSGKISGNDVATFIGTVFIPSLNFGSIRSLFSFRRSFKSLLDSASFGEKLLIGASLLHAITVEKKILEKLENHSAHISRTYVFLNSANAIEAAWARSFGIAGNKIVSLQHGIFVDFATENIPFDFINYCNITADMFLGWSKSAVAVVERYAPTVKLHVGGRLGGYDLAHFVRKLRWNDSGRRICVLGRDFHFEHNIQLLNLVSDDGSPVDVCFHPASNVELYKKACPFPLREVSKADFVRGSDFFLVGNSSMYFDLIMSGYAAALYAEGNNDFHGLHSFKCKAELRSLVSTEGERELFLTEDQTEVLKDFVGLGVDDYDRLLSS